MLRDEFYVIPPAIQAHFDRIDATIARVEALLDRIDHALFEIRDEQNVGVDE